MEFPGIFFNTSLLTELKTPDQHKIYDMLILGGGPAAMSAAIYAARKMLDIAIITIDFGGQVKETSEVENYLGFQNINANELISRFEEHVKAFNLPVNTGVAIKEIVKEENIFKVLMEDGSSFSGKSIILATGEHHKTLSVPGERELTGKGVSYCSICDAPLYVNKKVIIVGGGNSAFTTGLDLSRGNTEIIIVNLAKGWQADEILIQRLRNYRKVQLLDLHELISVNGKDKVESVTLRNLETNEEKTIQVDGIFIEAGYLPNSDPVKNLVNLNDKGEVIIDCICRTNVPGFFAAGDVTSIPYKQIIISAGEGAKAALSAYDYLNRFLENKNYDTGKR
jgi:alkyl hydroperoxide reductase subunit F